MRSANRHHTIFYVSTQVYGYDDNGLTLELFDTAGSFSFRGAVLDGGGVRFEWQDGDNWKRSEFCRRDNGLDFRYESMEPNASDQLSRFEGPWTRGTRTMRAQMASRVSHTTIDCHDAFRLSTWWKQALGYNDIAGDPNEPGDEECMIIDTAGWHRILFVEVPNAKSLKNRMHLDLAPTDRTRDAEVERIVTFGATELADYRNPDGSRWVTLADPEGNEFCVVCSDAERVRQA